METASATISTVDKDQRQLENTGKYISLRMSRYEYGLEILNTRRIIGLPEYRVLRYTSAG